MSRTPARVTQADVARAVRAAAKAGPAWRVAVMPDGSIHLFQGDPPPAAGAPATPPKIELLREPRL